MIKRIVAIAVLVSSIAGCSNDTNVQPPKEDSANITPVLPSANNDKVTDSVTKKTYSNERFRNVTVEAITSDSFRVRGQAQIFEASFGWVIEDGHNELKQGFTTSDAGAPEWGNFDFSFKATKARENSTLHLILFETSMKDGSRVHQLPIPLK